MSDTDDTQNTQTISDEVRIEVYRRLSEDFRQMNDIFWRAPTILITITGGLGLALATLDLEKALRIGLAYFIIVHNCIWVVILIRLRLGVMERLLKESNEIIQIRVAKSNWPFKHTVLWLFILLLFLVSAGLLVMALNYNYFFGVEQTLPAHEQEGSRRNFINAYSAAAAAGASGS